MNLAKTVVGFGVLICFLLGAIILFTAVETFWQDRGDTSAFTRLLAGLGFILVGVLLEMVHRKLKKKQAASLYEIGLVNEADADDCIALARLLSDNNSEFIRLVKLYLNGNTEKFWSEMETHVPSKDDMHFFIDAEKDFGIEAVLSNGLDAFGFIGRNDWKSPLADLLHNSQKAFAHYGIDMSVYESIPNKDSICAPEALQLMSEKLPPNFEVGLWDFGDDSYNLIVAPKVTLEAAAKLSDNLGFGIFSNCKHEY